MALQYFVVQKCNTPEEFFFGEESLQLNWYFRLVDTASASRMKNGQQSNRMKNRQQSMHVNVKGCYSSIISGSGSELHYYPGIESTSAMHGIASMYRFLKQFKAGDASQQLYFTKPAAVYGGNRLRSVTVLICCATRDVGPRSRCPARNAGQGERARRNAAVLNNQPSLNHRAQKKTPRAKREAHHQRHHHH